MKLISSFHQLLLSYVCCCKYLCCSQRDGGLQPPRSLWSCALHHDPVIPTLPFLLHPQRANSSQKQTATVRRATCHVLYYLVIASLFKKKKKNRRETLCLISIPANAQATVSRPKPVNTEKKWLEILVKLCMEYGLLISSIQFCLMSRATVNVRFLRNAEEKRSMDTQQHQQECALELLATFALVQECFWQVVTEYLA